MTRSAIGTGYSSSTFCPTVVFLAHGASQPLRRTGQKHATAEVVAHKFSEVPTSPKKNTILGDMRTLTPR